MKTMKLKNKHISDFYNALDNIKVEGFNIKRGKGKLQNALKRKLEEYQEDLTDINKVYFKRKSDGEFERVGNKLVWFDEYKDNDDAKNKANEQVKELLDEEIGIDLVEYETKIKTFFESLKEDKFTADERLKDDDFELLVDMLETAFENNKEEK